MRFLIFFGFVLATTIVIASAASGIHYLIRPHAGEAGDSIITSCRESGGVPQWVNGFTCTIKNTNSSCAVEVCVYPEQDAQNITVDNEAKP